MDKKLIIAKINYLMDELVSSNDYRHHRQIQHFYALKNRIAMDKKLTKKMKENLAWIEQNVIEQEGKRNVGI